MQSSRVVRSTNQGKVQEHDQQKEHTQTDSLCTSSSKDSQIIRESFKLDESLTCEIARNLTRSALRMWAGFFWSIKKGSKL
jgi:hypothetical protein